MSCLTRREGLAGMVSFAALAGCSPATGAADADAPTAEIALDLTGPRPTASLFLGETGPAVAIFDSGAAGSVIQLPLAARAGLPNKGDADASGPGGVPVRGFQTAISGRLGEAAFSDQVAVALDIPVPLPGIEAVISPSVFRGRLVRFDFARGVAQVLARTAANTPAGEAGSYSLNLNPFTMTSLPMAKIDLAGLQITAMTDTGAARGLVMPMAMAGKLPLGGPLVDGVGVKRVGGSFKVKVAPLKGTMRVGGVAFENPLITFAEGVPDNNLGFEVLRHTVLVLDPGKRVWVLPPA